MNEFVMRAATRAFPFVLLALAGCAGTVPPLPLTDVPQEWTGPRESEAAIWPSSDWWNSFANEELSAIVDQVQANNLDLANNRRNLEAAQIALREAGFNLLPSPVVTLGTGASYNETRSDLGNSSRSVPASVTTTSSASRRPTNAPLPTTTAASRRPAIWRSIRWVPRLPPTSSCC
jgi:outer membrane protein, multidrug efflux system